MEVIDDQMVFGNEAGVGLLQKMQHQINDLTQNFVQVTGKMQNEINDLKRNSTNYLEVRSRLFECYSCDVLTVAYNSFQTQKVNAKVHDPD
jgi:hypothetical protein